MNGFFVDSVELGVNRHGDENLFANISSSKRVEKSSRIHIAIIPLYRVIGLIYLKQVRGGRFLLCNTDVLWLGEEMQRLGSAFATNAASFHADEGNAEIADEPAIHPNCAGVNLFGDT